MDFDFLSSNLQIAYPFRDDVMVSRPDGDTDVSGLLAALSYYTYDQRDADLYLDRVDLRSSDGFTTLDSALVELRWSDGTLTPLEDGENAVAGVYAYGNWIVVSMRGTSSAVDPAVLHLIFPADKTMIEAFEGSSSSSSSSSSSPAPVDTFRFWKKADDIEILSSLVKQGPAKLRRVFLKRGDELVQVAAPGEQVYIGKGFNMSIEAQERLVVDGRQLSPVVLAAIPGAGAGKYLLCQNDAFLRTLSGVSPTEIGTVKLSPEECYWLERSLSEGPTPLAVPRNGLAAEGVIAPNELQLHNSCGACCSCEDYVEAYDHLRELWDRARVASENFYAARDDYHALLNDYDAALGSAALLTASSYLRVKCLTIVNMRNDTGATLPAGVTITFTFSSGGVAIEPDSGYLSGPSQRGLVDPTDLGGSHQLTLEEPVPPNTSISWTGIWTKDPTPLPDETLDVQVTIANGYEASVARIVTFEGL